MIASWSAYVVSPAGESTPAFWLTVLLVSPLYLWGAVEAISLGLVLRKRARLGLSDPLVADRTMQFGISGAAVVASIGVSWTAQFIYGAPPPVWTATLASCALLVGAVGIWLGFFPPAAYRARVESSLGAE